MFCICPRDYYSILTIYSYTGDYMHDVVSYRFVKLALGFLSWRRHFKEDVFFVTVRDQWFTNKWHYKVTMAINRLKTVSFYATTVIPWVVMVSELFYLKKLFSTGSDGICPWQIASLPVEKVAMTFLMSYNTILCHQPFDIYVRLCLLCVEMKQSCS